MLCGTVRHRVVCRNTNQITVASKSCLRANETVMATVYTLSEVAEHNSAKDSWLVIHGKVYDITRFMNDHPGGDEVLFPVSGRDATDDFENAGHSDNARKILSEFEIGVFEDLSIPKKLGKPEYIPEKSGDPFKRILRILVPLAILALALAFRFPKVKEALGLS